MGRAKLKMELITKETTRNTTYQKRKAGILKKANEFSILCDVDTLIIIYPPNSKEPEVWPEIPEKIKKIIGSYKSKKGESGRKTCDLKDFFQDRSKRIEDELKKARKKNMEAKYSTWFDELNGLNEMQLRQFAGLLENKECMVKAIIDKKNVLLSIENCNVQPNTSFAGFRLARDGKSLMFGENSHLSSQQQPISFSEMGNDNSSLQSLLTPPGTVGEPVMFSSQLSSLAVHLGVDEPIQHSEPPPPPGFDWNKAASFTESPSAIMTPPQSAGLQWTDWTEPPSGNEANANSDIFSDFTSTSFLSEFCETGTVGDESGVDATVVSVFDDLLFDNQELTLDNYIHSLFDLLKSNM